VHRVVSILQHRPICLIVFYDPVVSYERLTARDVRRKRSVLSRGTECSRARATSDRADV